MPTGQDIVTAALHESGVVGVGQTPNAEDSNTALDRLNQMIAQWRIKRFLVYRLTSAKVVSDGSQSYTFGPSGDVTTDVDGNSISVRPDKLEYAFLRQITQSTPNQVDYPLELILSQTDYSKITLKQLESFPTYLWWDPTLTNGTAYPWPVPQSAIYEIHLGFKMPLASLALADTIQLPPETDAALLYNLALRLRSRYRIPAPAPGQDDLKGLARDSLQVLREANTGISRLGIPADLVRTGVYNPYSDQIR